MKKKLLISLIAGTTLFCSDSNSNILKKNVQSYKQQLKDVSKKVENAELLKYISEIPPFKNKKILFYYADKFKLDTVTVLQARTNKGDFSIFETESGQYFVTSGIHSFQKYLKSTDTFEPTYIHQDLTDVRNNSLLKLGTGSTELIYVTNFECKNCKLLHERLKMQPELLNKYTFYIIPVSFKSADGRLSYKSTMMIKKILLQPKIEDKSFLFNQYMSLEYSKDIKTLNRGDVLISELDNKVEEFEKIAFRLGASSTPVFFKLNGKPLSVKNIFNIR